jgi:hypothetical protein
MRARPVTDRVVGEVKNDSVKGSVTVTLAVTAR